MHARRYNVAPGACLEHLWDLMPPASLQILSSVLLWNFALTSQLEKLPSKIQRDFVPTLVNGKHVAFAFCVLLDLRKPLNAALGFIGQGDND